MGDRISMRLAAIAMVWATTGAAQAAGVGGGHGFAPTFNVAPRGPAAGAGPGAPGVYGAGPHGPGGYGHSGYGRGGEAYGRVGGRIAPSLYPSGGFWGWPVEQDAPPAAEPIQHPIVVPPPIFVRRGPPVYGDPDYRADPVIYRLRPGPGPKIVTLPQPVRRRHWR